MKDLTLDKKKKKDVEMKHASRRGVATGVGTSEPRGGLATYLHEISQHELLTREEEVDLASRIATGDEAARHRMIVSNLRLVVRIAKDFASYGIPIEDLISAGNVGLITAAERYDPSFGTKFSGYAAFWIKQQMRRAIDATSRSVRLPSHVYEKRSAIRKAAMEIRHRTGREATSVELAESTGLTAKTVRLVQRATQSELSLDAPATDPTDGVPRTLGEVVAGVAEPEMGLDAELERASRLRDALAQLPDRQRLILVGRFGLDGSVPRTLEALGDDLGISRERVRQLQKSALDKLRKLVRERGLSPEMLELGVIADLPPPQTQATAA